MKLEMSVNDMKNKIEVLEYDMGKLEARVKRLRKENKKLREAKK